MKIIDGDSNEVVERFPVTLIHQPTAFNHHNHIYDNILIFTVQHPDEPQGIFVTLVACWLKFDIWEFISQLHYNCEVAFPSNDPQSWDSMKNNHYC